MNIDDADIPTQGNTGQARRLQIVSAILWGLVISVLAALQLKGPGALAVIDLLQLGGITSAIAIVVLGVAGILYKTLKYVGMTVTMIKRVFYLMAFIVIGVLASSFLL